MYNPKEPYLRLAHSVEERLMTGNFCQQRRRMIDLVVRTSLGCGKKAAYIRRQRDFEVVGIGENRIKAHLDWLINARVIIREGCYYWLNMDCERVQIKLKLASW